MAAKLTEGWQNKSKPATLSPTVSVLPLKGKTKEKKGFAVLLLLEDGKRKAPGHYTEAFLYDDCQSH